MSEKCGRCGRYVDRVFTPDRICVFCWSKQMNGASVCPHCRERPVAYPAREMCRACYMRMVYSPARKVRSGQG